MDGVYHGPNLHRIHNGSVLMAYIQYSTVALPFMCIKLRSSDRWIFGVVAMNGMDMYIFCLRLVFKSTFTVVMYGSY